jgi:hypothetical protein
MVDEKVVKKEAS